MSLSKLIRRKSEPVGFATATVATFATLEGEKGRTVASVATVTVAKSPQGQPSTMTASDEVAIRAWLSLIDETDPAIIGDVISMCRSDAGARAYYLGRAKEVPADDWPPDDRRTCRQCWNMSSSGRCRSPRIAGADLPVGSIVRADLPRRCVGFRPLADDPDQRAGRQRWPGLR